MAAEAISERAIEQFRAIFEDAQREITSLLANYQALQLPGAELGRLRVLSKQIDEILDAAYDPAAQWIETWLPRSYGNGTLYATRSLHKLGVADDTALRAGFAVVDRNSIYALTESMADDLAVMLDGIERNITRVIRASQMPIEIDIASSKAIGTGLVTGKGIKGIQQELLDILAGQVIPGGYRGTLRSYAELLARTRTREAQTAGALIRYDQYGIELVRVPSHGGACPICAPWQGAVLSIKGEHPGYPSLASIGPPPWHPNCVDVLAPFVEELARPEEIQDGQQAAEAGLRSLKKAA